MCILDPFTYFFSKSAYKEKKYMCIFFATYKKVHHQTILLEMYIHLE